MRDIVGDLAHAGHQPLDLVEHAVEVGGELVELVVGAAPRHPVRQIAGDDPLGGAVHLLDPAQHVAAHDRAAAKRPIPSATSPDHSKRRPDAVAERRGVADVARHQQAIAVRDREQHAARRVGLDLAVRAGSSIWNDNGPGRAGAPAGQPLILPASGRPSAIGHQVQHAVAAVAGAAGGDDLDEAAEPALGILLGQPGDLGAERRLGLPLDEIGAGPVDEQQDADHRQRRTPGNTARPAGTRGFAPAAAPPATARQLGAGRPQSRGPSADGLSVSGTAVRRSSAEMPAFAGTAFIGAAITRRRAGNSRRRAPCAAAGGRNSCRSSGAAG